MEQEHARCLARLENGAYILRGKRLSDTEESSTIRIPEVHSQQLDTRCVVYKNFELGTSSIACNGILFQPPLPPS